MRPRPILIPESTRAHDKETQPLLSNALPAEDLPAAATWGALRKFLVLALASIALFGNDFGYVNPTAINTQLRAYMEIEYEPWQYKFNLLYAVCLCLFSVFCSV